jgi:type I restriction enzyme R subunit
MSWEYSEDNLVEQATCDIFKDLGWQIETAWHNETFGEAGLLGRENKSEVILSKFLLPALEKLNPNLPKSAYKDAFLKIIQKEADKKLDRINKEKYQHFKSGVQVSYTDEKGKLNKKTLRVFDFDNPENNHFLVVRQLEVAGELYSRRPDVVAFVNGIPLVFMELKAHHRDLRHAYDDNLKDYKDTIPHLFNSNAFIILSNGLDTNIGTITSPYKFFHEWKRINENEEGKVSLDTTIRGTCAKDKLMDLFENFIVFEDAGGDLIKILAKNHQFLGVNKVINNAKSLEDLKGKLGVFWHTQGSGKSFSMVFLSEKIHRKFEGSFTILIVLDRTELETQIYNTFTAVGAVKEKHLLAKNRDDLRKLLKENHRYVFTLIHKFSINAKEENEYPLLSERKDIIVLSDEAHRTQGGVFARNMRFNALPYASYIGFTGTPIIKGEQEYTKNIFGDYVSVYDFKSSIEDGATLPLTYVNKGEKLHIENPDLDVNLIDLINQENLDEEQRLKVERALASNYPVMTSEKRLRSIAKDLVWHFNERGYQGKAMLVTLDKPTAVRMFDYISEYWSDYLTELKTNIEVIADEQKAVEKKAHFDRVKSTEICVVVSSEQNEVDKFKKLGLDIATHRRKLVERDLEKEFKDDNNPFRLAIVCAMWITGFDVPSISTIYLDKPIKGHTLMQTIARANRVYDDEKENGLIVDYGNVYKQLEEAYSIYGEGTSGSQGGGDKPTKNIDELSSELNLAVASTCSFLLDLGFKIEKLFDASPLDRLSFIQEAINSVCLNDTTRAKFEVNARNVANKYKALYPEEEVKQFTQKYNAIDAIYSGLNQEVIKADITQLMKKLQELVGDSIQISSDSDREDVFIDLSNLNFEKLRELFDKHPMNKIVYDLQEAIDQKLKRMMQKNPHRANFYKKYLKIIQEYNEGKDEEAIKKAFIELMKFVDELNNEEKRSIRENLDEETLAIYDLLHKDSLSRKEEESVKKVAKDTLDKLKQEKLKVSMWRESAQVSAQIRILIRNSLLYLPQEQYPDEEIDKKTLDVYQHIYSNYYGNGLSIYDQKDVHKVTI